MRCPRCGRELRDLDAPSPPVALGAHLALAHGTEDDVAVRFVAAWARPSFGATSAAAVEPVPPARG
ncbi:MAG: hypothetical protein JST54_03155 [Deltaproteobacteria bacterium]|nr:hypothetical protein [Deltaproteobacteria bacterium]